LYQEQGKIYLNQSDFDRALAAFAQALERDPDLPETYYQRGITRVEMGDYQGAIADFDAAIRRDPHYALAYGGRGLAHFYLAEPDQALPDLNQALGLFQDQGNFPAYQQTLSLIAAIEAGESPTPSAPQPSGPILP
jgi:tetratricopeptide (TPR) repeat protein